MAQPDFVTHALANAERAKRIVAAWNAEAEGVKVPAVRSALFQVAIKSLTIQTALATADSALRDALSHWTDFAEEDAKVREIRTILEDLGRAYEALADVAKRRAIEL